MKEDVKTVLIVMAICIVTAAVVVGGYFGIKGLVQFFDALNKAADVQDAQIESDHDKAIKACTDRSGIPILSAWDGRLIRCEGIK